MPQLNPEPWFLILVSSWVIFLTLIPPKILSHCTPNEPNSQGAEEMKVGAWNWPWH
uniref:ATP synthase complex subunit 8 n=2 Tax=Epiplatys TaxID=52655 RepID=A0A518DK34_9TELE|nr:ATP synthase F0 subunit 8 [Epiplatys multifasciatus]YP_009685781.1 ATP synthase F0 subunit 8 [Epiplatys spilargyreius]QDU24558.1 ATP synthase F0 subunit 8 [Epiplatys multifasciatus]QDU91874.1 ATP synthase F0 subunit 8 [Epiplatys spilargyreius]